MSKSSSLADFDCSMNASPFLDILSYYLFTDLIWGQRISFRNFTANLPISIRYSSVREHSLRIVLLDLSSYVTKAKAAKRLLLHRLEDYSRLTTSDSYSASERKPLF